MSFLTAEQETRLNELHALATSRQPMLDELRKILGAKFGAPAEITGTSLTSTGVELSISGDPRTAVVVERQ